MSVRMLAIGNGGVDVYSDAKRAGGHGVNFAAYCAKLGAEAGYIGVIGNDENGEIVKEALVKNGVDISHIRQVDGETGYCGIELTDGTASISCGNKGGIQSKNPVVLTDEDKEYIKTFDIVSVDSRGHFDDQLEELKKCGIPISYDFNKELSDEKVAAVAPLINFAFISCEGMNEEDTKKEIEKVFAYGLTTVTATRGGDPVISYDGHRYYPSKTLPAKVVDTTGAGDAYGAGALYHIFFYTTYRGWTDVQDGRFLPASITSECMYKGVATSKKAATSLGAICEGTIYVPQTERFGLGK